MEYYVPTLLLAALSTRAAVPEDQLGGVPFGLPRSRWPVCPTCDAPASLLAQILHDERRADLGADGRVLYVFHCENRPGDCGVDERERLQPGVIVDQRELTSSRTTSPDDSPITFPEARVVAWRSNQDGIAESLRESLTRGCAPDTDAEDSLVIGTRLGSAPWWIQSPGDAPPPPWRFIGQVADWYSFDLPAPSAEELGAPVVRERLVPSRSGVMARLFGPGPDRVVFTREDPSVSRPMPERSNGDIDVARVSVDDWSSTVFNFGDAGMSYIFVNLESNPPQACSFLQS